MANVGLIMADDFSIMEDAWCSVLRSPQRRRRIYLISDFNGTSAGKILFESEGLSGDIIKSQKSWKETAGYIRTSTSDAVCFGVDGYKFSNQRCRINPWTNCGPIHRKKWCHGLQIKAVRGWDVHEDRCGTITASVGNHPPVVFENHGQDSRFRGPLDVSNTLGASLGTGEIISRL